MVDRGRGRARAVDVAHVRPILRGLIPGSVGRVGGYGVKLCRLLLIEVLDRAFAVAGGDQADDRERKYRLNLHRLPPFDSGRRINARTANWDRAALADATKYAA